MRELADARRLLRGREGRLLKKFDLDARSRTIGGGRPLGRHQVLIIRSLTRMKYDQLIQLYFERSTALQWYWTIYVLVIGGLLAYSSFRQRRDWITTALVTVLFSFFAYKNLDSIHDVTRE